MSWWYDLGCIVDTFHCLKNLETFLVGSFDMYGHLCVVGKNLGYMEGNIASVCLVDTTQLDTRRMFLWCDLKKKVEKISCMEYLFFKHIKEQNVPVPGSF